MRPKLILASASPQRKEILTNLNLSFEAHPSQADEHHGKLTRPFAIARMLALRKAESVAQKFSSDWVLGCDTMVVLPEGHFALKPKNRAEARETIRLYRNSYCDVYSGLALVHFSKKKALTGYEKTRLFFGTISDTDIETYLDSGEWRDRSGSMTIEGRGGKWIKKIQGDYWNVVGLPVKLLKKFLKRLKG